MIDQIMETYGVTRRAALSKTTGYIAFGGRFETEEVECWFASPATMRSERDDNDEVNDCLRDMGW